MPRRDGTGPIELGAGSGWGRGGCVPGSGYGRGLGRGFGRSLYNGFSNLMPWNWRNASNPTADDPQAELNDLEMTQKNIMSRIAEIKKNLKG